LAIAGGYGNVRRQIGARRIDGRQRVPIRNPSRAGLKAKLQMRELHRSRARSSRFILGRGRGSAELRLERPSPRTMPMCLRVVPAAVPYLHVGSSRSAAPLSDRKRMATRGRPATADHQQRGSRSGARMKGSEIFVEVFMGIASLVRLRRTSAPALPCRSFTWTPGCSLYCRRRPPARPPET